MSSTANAANAYDRVTYPSGAHAQTHPDRLAALGVLYGMVPPAVEHCRVLEIGCSQGGNLVPMAFGLPGSEFVGIDLAAKLIERAQAWIDRLRLRNIQVRQMDLMEIGTEFGQFDYIIAHGLYSWIPAPAQDKLLAICNQNLGANGVAFVSYNANPGGHVRRMVREMMQFHTRRIEDSEERAREGKAFLGLLLESMDAHAPCRMVFQEEFDRMSKRTDHSIYHDELSPDFSPIHFADFVERAAGHGLLGEVCSHAPEGAQRETAEDLSQAVLTLAAMALVELRTYRLPVADRVSERPEASLLARLEAKESNVVTTLIHSHVKLKDEPEQKFLQLLDGTRDRHVLADAIAGDHPDVSREVLLEQIDSNLANIYRMGLLMA